MLGLVSGALCALAIELTYKWAFDDSLDVVGIHLVGGLVETLHLGFFDTGTGPFMGGDGTQLLAQAVAAFGVLGYSLVLTPHHRLRHREDPWLPVNNEDQVAGVDLAEHGETG